MLTRAARPNPPVSFRLKNRSEGPLIAHIRVDLPPDAHPAGLFLELKDGQEGGAVAAGHEFRHDVRQLISALDINIYRDLSKELHKLGDFSKT